MLRKGSIRERLMEPKVITISPEEVWVTPSWMNDHYSTWECSICPSEGLDKSRFKTSLNWRAHAHYTCRCKNYFRHNILIGRKIIYEAKKQMEEKEKTANPALWSEIYALVKYKLDEIAKDIAGAIYGHVTDVKKNAPEELKEKTNYGYKFEMRIRIPYSREGVEDFKNKCTLHNPVDLTPGEKYPVSYAWVGKDKIWLIKSDKQAYLDEIGHFAVKELAGEVLSG